MSTAIGQLNQHEFVMRLYEEQALRLRLVAYGAPDDPDRIIGHKVECSVGAGDLAARHHSTHFGVSPEEFARAGALFTNWTRDYLAYGRLP